MCTVQKYQWCWARGAEENLEYIDANTIIPSLHYSSTHKSPSLKLHIQIKMKMFFFKKNQWIRDKTPPNVLQNLN